MFKIFSKYNVSVLLLVLVVSLCSAIEAATVDITSFGAVGTGNEADASTNVTAFADAIAAAGDGGTVIAPPGVYYINAKIDLFQRENLTLDGYGATIKRVSTGNPSKMDMIGLYYGGDGCVIQGFSIDGNRSDSTSSPYSSGIVSLTAIDFTVKDCDIKNCSFDGVYITAEYMSSGAINRKKGYGTIDNCNITNNHRNGVSITDSSGGCVIKNSSFAGNDLHAIDVEPNFGHTKNHTIANCTFDDDNLVLYTTHQEHTLVWDVTVEDCNFVNGANLNCYASRNIVASNNTFLGGGAIFFNGFYPSQDGQGKITLAGNSVAGVTNNGINLLANSSFESWSSGIPNNWTGTGTGTYQIASSALRALDAATAVFLTATAGTATLKQAVSVTAGKHYTFGGYISREAISGSANPPYTSVNFLDAGNAILKSIDLRAYYEYAKYGIYEKAMAITQAPAGTVTAEVIVGVGNPGSFSAFFDGLFFYEGVGPDGGDLTLANEKVMRFDFGQQGDTPAPDYLHVDLMTTYGYDPNTDLTYGIFGPGTAGVTADDHSSWQTRKTPTDLTLTGLRFPNANFPYETGFELEVPNGTYLVTVFAGNVAWNNTGRIMMEGGGGAEGLRYSATDNPANLYMVDVFPDIDPGPGTSDGILTWTQDQNYTKHGALYFGQIKTWGYNNDNPYLSAAEGLYLQDQSVTITDGKLTVYGISYNGETEVLLNYIEVVKEPVLPPVNCNEVWQNDFGLSADLDQDCHVGLDDLGEFLNNWLVCNDPLEPGCIRNY